MSTKIQQHSQPRVQVEAQRLENLLRRRKRLGRKNKSRSQIVQEWLECQTSSAEFLSKATTLQHISVTSRRLLLDHPHKKLYDGREILLQWEKTPVRQEGMFRTKSHSNIQLKEGAKEIESWLFSLAIYILWKKESNCTEALALCSKAIGLTSTHLNTYATMSPRSHADKEDNEDKKLSLKLLLTRLQKYETMIAGECVQSRVSDESNQTSSSKCIHKQRLESLRKRMEYNKKKLDSLHEKMDFKASMINLSLKDIANERSTRTDEDTTISSSSQETESNMCKRCSCSNYLYPHLIYHPYFNVY
mmetsp:Transcript_4009/g.5229  ORF Transcript_4009/g.5229 Transcript_4009/m.5229 type:complete len:304 (+) Transcript_4009:206-1117(+)